MPGEIMIKFHCSACGQKIGVPKAYARKKVKCPTCQNINHVPKMDETELEEKKSALDTRLNNTILGFYDDFGDASKDIEVPEKKKVDYVRFMGMRLRLGAIRTFLLCILCIALYMLFADVQIEFINNGLLIFTAVTSLLGIIICSIRVD